MFQGVGTAVITPFNKNMEVDYDDLKNIVRMQVQAGADSIIVLGTTGECPTITLEERKHIVSAVVKQVDGKIPVIVGTGTNDSTKVIKYNKLAEACGANGLLIVTPYYNKSTQAGLFKSFKFYADNTKLPIILYNVPSRTGVNFNIDTILQLHEDCKNIVGVKEASGDISYVAELIARKPKTLKVFSGNDDQALPLMALGGDGLISVIGNILPGQMVEMTHAILEGKMDKAREINNRFNKLMGDLFLEVNPIPVKYAAALLNICDNSVRLPLVIMSEKNAEQLTQTMKEMDLV